MFNFLKNISFQNPNLLWLLPFILVLIAWRIFQNKKQLSVFKMSNSLFFEESLTSKLKILPFLLRLIALALLITALARPQTALSWQNSNTEGIDIVVAIDVSGSMLAEDFKPNRLEASKEVAMNFISNRPNDRIGLVVYGGESFTQCPLTTDKDVLLNLFKDVKNGMVEDGTAIGIGLSKAISRLKDSKAKSKIVILITDGSNTTGNISPTTAANIAQAFNVRVYTIGVGSKGTARTPFFDQFGNKIYRNIPVTIDEETLKNIAKVTDGKYYRAVNKKKLKKIYREIDKLEKSKIEVTDFRKKEDVFLPFALSGTILLLIELIIKNTWFRSVL